MRREDKMLVIDDNTISFVKNLSGYDTYNYCWYFMYRIALFCLHFYNYISFLQKL